MTHSRRPSPALIVGTDGIGWIIFDDPNREVNLLTRPVMEEFTRCIREVEVLGESGKLKAVVLWSGKATTFLAGADVGDIERLTDPALGEEGCRMGQGIFRRLEDLPVPSLAAIHGACLGGGLEMALACSRRIVSEAEETRLGFPEILLGILPAWGGTTRLPRLVGLQQAARMILSGKRYSAARALAVGLVDGILPAHDFKARALEEARRLVTQNPLPRQGRRRIPSLMDRFPLGRRLVLRAARKRVVAQTRGHYPGPETVLDVLEASWGLPLSEALALEARAAGNLIASPVSKNLIHLFHLREDARKGKGIPQEYLSLAGSPTPGRHPETVGERVVHRILTSYMNEARALLREGAGSTRIDRVARAFGMENGPFDLIRAEKSHEAHGEAPDSDLSDRLVLSMVAEASALLEGGVVSRAGEIDLAVVLGAGFPPFRGGLLRHADQAGIPGLVTRSRTLAQQYGPRYAPGHLLMDLAQTGDTFYSRFP
jgi:enoyl-CoA hydratase/carnithine racemase